MQHPAGGKATKRHITPTNAVITPTKKNGATTHLSPIALRLLRDESAAAACG
jgi:hypothetical protein